MQEAEWKRQTGFGPITALDPPQATQPVFPLAERAHSGVPAVTEMFSKILTSSMLPEVYKDLSF